MARRKVGGTSSSNSSSGGSGNARNVVPTDGIGDPMQITTGASSVSPSHTAEKRALGPDDGEHFQQKMEQETRVATTGSCAGAPTSATVPAPLLSTAPKKRRVVALSHLLEDD